MSVEAMTIALHHSKATGAAKTILIGIANHLGDGGAWPSMSTLARYGNVDKRNARKAVERLEKLGEIRRSTQAGGTADMLDAERPNLYFFLLQCPESCDRSVNHRSKYSRSVTLGETPRALSSGGDDSARRGEGDSALQTVPRTKTKTKRSTYVPERERARSADACPTTGNAHRWNTSLGYCADCFSQVAA